MGLSLTLAASIGAIDRDELRPINALLREHGLPAHHEPRGIKKRIRAETVLSDLQDDLMVTLSYEDVHFLRRFQLRRQLTPGTQIAPLHDPWHDPIFRDLQELPIEQLEVFHLSCHSDVEGYYVPIDFERVLSDPAVRGEMLGSSQRLFAELLALGPALEIPWRGEKPPLADVDRIEAGVATEPPFWREKIMFLVLYDLARLSLQFGTAIVFL